MMKLIKPDWKNSILNVSATLAEYIGVKTNIAKGLTEKEMILPLIIIKRKQRRIYEKQKY